MDVPDTGLVELDPALPLQSTGADTDHMAAILHGLARGLVSYDQASRIRFANRAVSSILGLAPGCSDPGTPLLSALEGSALLDRAGIEAIHEAARATAADREPRQLFAAVGTPPRSMSVEVCPLPDGTSLLRIADVTERLDAAARAIEQAQHDALTGLPGRQLFSERLTARLRIAGEDADAKRVAVLMVDLDRFKSVNDTLGHPVGDEVLRLVARRMRTVLRDDDMLTRFGGDEFGIMLEGRTTADISGVGARLLEVLGRPYLACGHLVNIGASIGIARAGDHATDAESLLRYADLALYSVKAAGRNGCAVFDPAMDARAHARRVMEIDLRRALTLRQFEVYYQPQVALDGNRLCGFEALVRWRHPERGMISPAEFIPLAEEIGLIGAIGQWVLEVACREATTWPADFTLAVNVSARQFEDGRLVEMVRQTLASTGLAGPRLELEITESVLMRNEHVVGGILHDLRALGVRVAMDDFGTGYSSLSQLRSFPFDKIKIDRSFVSNFAVDGNTAIIRAIAAMGASLGMATIAEGVETSEELAQIRAEGCDAVQGYFFSRPVPASELPALIATLNNVANAAA